HPNFLRIEGKPVIFFTDVYRTDEISVRPPQVVWAQIRDLVDPFRRTIWIAEGLDPTYLDVFDGLYVFKITHANAPTDYEKATQWAEQVRAWADSTGQDKVWAATISPGWDDLRSACRPDARVPNTPHRLDRANGATYQATFQAALASNPDWLLVGSFNEWVEGTYIEPSQQHGDRYLQLTAEFVERFKAQ
ncbi:MAG: glycoside hydrolase family 99-like domain-containing protein, partial [Anaerolineae bacterium]|nr:glycoside hydrolase family 99-like domain-containing protein [Anaerolineae bacterium]